jgi:HEAT repeat protein
MSLMLRIEKLTARAVALFSLLLFNLDTPVTFAASPTPNPGCPSGTSEQQTEEIRRILQDPESSTVYLRSRHLYTGPILQLLQTCGQATIPALSQIITSESTLQPGSSQTKQVAMRILSEVGGTEAINRLAIVLKSDTNAETRQQAATLLGNISNEPVLNALASALQTEREATVRVSIVQALANMGRQEGGNLLRQTAQTDLDPGVRLSALVGLNAIPRSGVSDLLITALQSEQNPEARRTAARVLGRISTLQARKNWLSTFYAGKELSDRLQSQASAYDFTTYPIDAARAKAALMQALKADPDVRTRHEAAEGLGNLGDKTTRNVLIAALQSDPQRLVRQTAAEALGKIGDNASREPLIAAMRQDAASEVRLAAATSLGRMGGRHIKNALIAALSNPQDSVLRAQIARILQDTYGNTPPARDTLVTILQSEQEPVQARIYAALALRRSNDPIVTQALIATLNIDTMTNVRAIAAETLGEIGNPLALNALSDALRTNPHPNVRTAAAIALGKIKQPEAKTILLDTLNTPQYSKALHAIAMGLGDAEQYSDVLHAIASGLRDTDRAAAIPVFLSLLQSAPNSFNRQNAAYALGEMRATQAIALLSRALQSDQDIYVRSGAANALAMIGDTESVQALLQVLNGRFAPEVRAFAANSLGKIANPVAIPPLITVMENGNEFLWLRTQAAYALSAMGVPAISPLRQSLSSANLQTQYLAITALAEMNIDEAREALSGEQATVIRILTTVNQQNLSVPYLKVVRAGTNQPTSGFTPRPTQRLMVCNLSWVSTNWRRCRQSHNPQVSYYPPRN